MTNLAKRFEAMQAEQELRDMQEVTREIEASTLGDVLQARNDEMTLLRFRDKMLFSSQTAREPLEEDQWHESLSGLELNWVAISLGTPKARLTIEKQQLEETLENLNFVLQKINAAGTPREKAIFKKAAGLLVAIDRFCRGDRRLEIKNVSESIKNLLQALKGQLTR